MLGRTMAYALAASILLGAVMTFGDWLWAAMQIRHTVAAGLLHGAAMCLFLGTVIGFRAGRVPLGAVAGPVIGILAAGLFYLLAPAFRMMAMFPAWMFFWICFAILQGWLQKDRGVTGGLVVGAIAAILSGVVFYAISGIWTRHDPGGPNYAWNFAAWTAAFFPGFAALFWRPAPARPA